MAGFSEARQPHRNILANLYIQEAGVFLPSPQASALAADRDLGSHSTLPPSLARTDTADSTERHTLTGRAAGHDSGRSTHIRKFIFIALSVSHGAPLRREHSFCLLALFERILVVRVAVQFQIRSHNHINCPHAVDSCMRPSWIGSASKLAGSSVCGQTSNAMDASREAALIGRLVSALTGFSESSENHTLASRYMMHHAVLHHSYPSSYSATVQGEVSKCVSPAFRAPCTSFHPMICGVAGLATSWCFTTEFQRRGGCKKVWTG